LICAETAGISAVIVHSACNESGTEEEHKGLNVFCCWEEWATGERSQFQLGKDWLNVFD
jgi:hypothetical protein